MKFSQPSISFWAEHTPMSKGLPVTPQRDPACVKKGGGSIDPPPLNAHASGSAAA